MDAVVLWVGGEVGDSIYYKKVKVEIINELTQVALGTWAHMLLTVIKILHKRLLIFLIKFVNSLQYQ